MGPIWILLLNIIFLASAWGSTDKDNIGMDKVLLKMVTELRDRLEELEQENFALMRGMEARDGWGGVGTTKRHAQWWRMMSWKDMREGWGWAARVCGREVNGVEGRRGGVCDVGCNVGGCIRGSTAASNGAEDTSCVMLLTFCVATWLQPTSQARGALDV